MRRQVLNSKSKLIWLTKTVKKKKIKSDSGFCQCKLLALALKWTSMQITGMEVELVSSLSICYCTHSQSRQYAFTRLPANLLSCFLQHSQHLNTMSFVACQMFMSR